MIETVRGDGSGTTGGASERIPELTPPNEKPQQSAGPAIALAGFVALVSVSEVLWVLAQRQASEGSNTPQGQYFLEMPQRRENISDAGEKIYHEPASGIPRDVA